MNDARRLTIRRLLAATAFFSVSVAFFSALPAAVASNLIAILGFRNTSPPIPASTVIENRAPCLVALQPWFRPW